MSLDLPPGSWAVFLTDEGLLENLDTGEQRRWVWEKGWVVVRAERESALREFVPREMAEGYEEDLAASFCRKPLPLEGPSGKVMEPGD